MLPHLFLYFQRGKRWLSPGSLGGPAVSHYSIFIITMNNPPELLLSLQQYIVQLQTENRSLKQHVFSLQQKMQAMRPAFHDELEKLKLYIDHCENEIMKRENRELALLGLVKELEEVKESVADQRDIYIQELESLRLEVANKQEEINKLKQESLSKIAVKNSHVQGLPPKSNKCRNCEILTRQQQILYQQARDYQQKISSLKRDADCLFQLI